ncbi:MAG TPA: ribonuclease P protein component [Gammaproteobacteria bacterium]|nr:ribonuclease P protein component [Gammaproteobacteria bacterium]
MSGSRSEGRRASTIVRDTAAGSEGFSPAQRLLSPVDFTRVLGSGRRSSDALFSVVAIPGPGPGARLGLAISRKVSRSAVQRNRIKRVVRECFRKQGTRLPALDIIVMARPGAAECDNHRLATSIEALLERTTRICEASRSS